MKGIIDATEEQDKLLDDKVERLVEKSMNAPSGGGSHTHSKETVIIQQQQEKQQRQDHTLINKLKEKVNQMELDHAKNQNLIQRLAAQCESASARAKRSEDLTKDLEKRLIEATSALNEQLNESLVEQMSQITTTIVENSEQTQVLIREAKKEVGESFELKIGEQAATMKEEFKVVTETVTKETMAKVEEKQAKRMKLLEKKQEEQITQLVERA